MKSKISIIQCPNCEARVVVKAAYQRPGFRDKEEALCPCCRTVLAQSMEYEFETELYKEREL